MGKHDSLGHLTQISDPYGNTVWVDHVWDLLNALNVNVNVNGTALLQTPYYHSFGKPYYWVYGNGTERDRFYNLDGKIYSLWYGNNTRDIA
jgi:hypothetical protein